MHLPSGPLYSGLDSPDTIPATFPSQSQHLRLYPSPSRTVARPGILGLLLASWAQEFLLNLSLEPGGPTLNSTRSSHSLGRPGQHRRVPTWSCLGPLLHGSFSHAAGSVFSKPVTPHWELTICGLQLSLCSGHSGQPE